MLAEDTFNVLIGIVMNDSSNGLIKVPEDIPQGTVSIFINESFSWPHRCWWRMLAIYVGDKFKILMPDWRLWCIMFHIEQVTNTMIPSKNLETVTIIKSPT